MSSSYSPLKIELMVTGENTLTWGDKTNANLNAFEEMVVGTAELVFNNANLPPLTLAQTNASQQGRCFRLHCTGDLGGSPRSLTLPTNAGNPLIKKTYLVHNDCATGPSDIIVKGAAVGATVTVPAGKITLVYYDGINVTSMITHLASLTAGTMSVTGAFSTASASIGSITTNGISTVAPGAHISIGQSGQLHIASADGNANGTSIIYNPSSDLHFWNATGGDRMILNAAGLGISRSPGCKLDVEGQGRFVTYSTIRAGGSGEATVQFVNNGADVELGTITGFAPGHMRYQANAGGVHYFVTNGAERVRIAADGNVGIGVSSPGHKLHVAGNVVLTDTTNFGFYGNGAGLIGTATYLSVGYAANAGNAYACSGNSATATTASNSNALGGQGPGYYLNYLVDQWKASSEGRNRLLFSSNSNTYYRAGGHVFRNDSDQDIMSLDGSGNLYAYANITAYSDRKLKTNLAPLTNGLDKVLLLNGYTYDRIDDPEGRRRVGLIAQEVQQVLPEVVIDHDGTLALDYGNMVALLVEAIKDLQKEVQQLKGYGR